MKKLLCISLFFIASSLSADRWDRAVSKNAGNRIETYSVSVNSTTPAQVIDPSIAIKAASIDVFNYSTSILWIGTNTATLVTSGFPVLSSVTYTTDGVFTGNIYGLLSSDTNGTWKAKVIYWLKNDYAN